MDPATLLKIDGELDSEEVRDLKFLCRDYVQPKSLEKVEAAHELFQQLEQAGVLEEDGLFLAELLMTIRRNVLLKSVLRTTPQDVEWAIRAQGGARISPYRKMLYKLGEDVTEETLRSFKFLVKVPNNKLESCKSFLDVLVEMEKQDLLGEGKLEELERILEKCNKQLAMKVREYAEGRAPAGGASRQRVLDHGFNGLDVRYSQDPRVLHLHHSRAVQDSNPSVSLPSSGEGSTLFSDAAPGHRPNQSDDFYKTSSRPLGYCLIINNYSFKEARMNGKSLGDRKGTERDAVELESVFTKLHFEVEVRSELGEPELKRAVEEFGMKDHSERDAFVCCVLSHGEKGSIYATDGVSVPIRTLTLPFTSSRCHSLAQKPKLFFIQACQGQDLQRPARIQADCEGEGEDEGAYEDDAGRFQPDTIPDDSDFLLGMATVEDYKSFRSVTQGSIFIQELCKQLIRGCREGEDILTIMTRVNREVSSGIYLKSKQMPEPRYTLRRRLVLPIDETLTPHRQGAAPKHNSTPRARGTELHVLFSHVQCEELPGWGGGRAEGNPSLEAGGSRAGQANTHNGWMSIMGK
ncbi:hypothetical protein AGOR_G00058440 [Albula goreensis]|uniref:Caspase-8 n=1 Tax=Albula goreensis TaxID=1534307 RepID=A0A8T3DUQ5_9TELE|nr:hypothetical protein AGOR_G00058440 [Albula goreensis]